MEDPQAQGYILLQTLQSSVHAMAGTINGYSHGILDIQTRASSSEERIRALEARVGAMTDTVSKMDPVALSGTGSHRQRLVDAKNLAPEVFSGTKGMQWRDWNHRMKCYMAAMKATVRHAMDHVERRTEPVLYEHLES